MAEFIFTKEKIVASGEKRGMILQKHTINEVPPTDKELLMAIDIGAANGYNLWTVGMWTESGWTCEWDKVGYTVIEWYELPRRQRTVPVANEDNYSYKQMKLEDFWNDK